MIPDTVLGLALVSLATFWAWETVLSVLPWEVPSYLQPFTVLVLAAGALYVPEVLLWAAASAGVVGLLHTAVRRSQEMPLSLQRPRRSRDPDPGPILPGGVGGRVPLLP
jgi:hypothetical protein